MPEGVDTRVPADDEFRRLMERVRAGCPQAARDMCNRYGGYIHIVVRRRLNQRMRAQYDSLDFLQDVWASFFGAADKYDFADPQSLIKHLAGIALHKVTDEYRRRFRSKKYNVSREQSLDIIDARSRPVLDPPVRDPTPSQVAIAKERWERILDGQTNRSRMVLELLRLGYTHEEIAARTGLHVKVIQRLLQKMAQRRDLT
ncbi:MAG TPA: sigma-70 family RNA polymerase sigma factor [Gemmataceae bacterium]|nr:sigma-70 family RNA polymerase sigma factor [Gemmataceae bacterium]